VHLKELLLAPELKECLRGITADPEAVAVVVMPELIVRGTDRLFPHQRTLYLLLFEPRLILASVPYQRPTRSTRIWSSFGIVTCVFIS
jgi:hypothetical protein